MTTSKTGFPGWWGAACGLLAAAAAMGIGQLLAGFTVPAASPVVAVGQVAINHTPLAVKDWATSSFGNDDKTVLLGGVLVVVFLYAMGVGAAAVWRLGAGFLGLAVFAAIGLAAALTRPNATASYAVPTLFGAAAGALALWWLVVTARAAAGRAVGTGQAGPVAGRTAATARSLPPIGFNPADRDRARRSGAGDQADADGGTDRADDPGQPPRQDEDDSVGWVAAGDAEPAGSLAGRSGAGPADKAGRYGTDESWDTDPWTGKAAPKRSGPPASGGAGGLVGPNGRRQFLVAAGVTVAAAAVGEFGGRSLSTKKNVSLAQQALHFPRPAVTAPPLPRGVNLPVPGISPFVTPNNQFYRVDTALIVPQVDPSNWTLRIHGMVEREVHLNFAELLHRPLDEAYITLCCVSNPVDGPYISNAKWLGASLAALIRSARPLAGADQLLSTSSDGFTSGTPLQVVLDGRDALLAVAMNGEALPTAHGFPARLVVPGLYGYVSACKWVTDIEVTTFAKAQGYWVPRGWSQMGPIKTESRIDVPTDGGSVKAGQVPVAGVAWAQHKGIDAVEVRVDKGAWHEATLAAVPGIDTWRQWVWQWPATKGTHLIEARATDKTGYTQTSVVADVAPNGASGYPATQVTVS